MQAMGSFIKFEKLKIDYSFWEAIFLYNKLGNFLWPDPAEPILKLTENELKCCFYEDQPKPWCQQFEELPNAPKPKDMMVEELKEHFKTKEDNHVKMQLKHAEQQQLDGLKKHKSAKQHNDNGDTSGSKFEWKKR